MRIIVGTAWKLSATKDPNYSKNFRDATKYTWDVALLTSQALLANFKGNTDDSSGL